MDFSSEDQGFIDQSEQPDFSGFHWITQGHGSSTGPMKVKARFWAGLMGKLCDSELREYGASWLPRRKVKEDKRGTTSNLDILTVLNFLHPAMPDTLSSGFTELSQYILFFKVATKKLLL